MARKVLLSFLGATEYKQCVYYTPTQDSGVVRFVQEALCDIVCKKWSKEDKVFIFLTDDANQKNWLGGLYGGKGLQKQLEYLDLPCDIKPVLGFKEGIGEEQIWGNFKIIFDALENDDEVWLDITNSFRSIPIFAAVLMSYAKFLKNIKSKSVFYGAFEAIGVPAHKVDQEIPEPLNRRAPILDLTSLIELQDWTISAEQFINFGNAKQLALSMENVGKKDLSENIVNICKDIAAVRSIAIFEGQDMNNVDNSITSLTEGKFNPLIPILNRVKDKIKGFQQQNILNGFVAVEWCIEHGLTQQGITLLSESIQTYVLNYLNEDWKNKDLRTLVSFFLTQKTFQKVETKINNDKNDDNLTKQAKLNLATRVFQLSFKTDLTKQVYTPLSQGARNDINHAGIRDNPKSADELSLDLDKYYKLTKTVLHVNI